MPFMSETIRAAWIGGFAAIFGGLIGGLVTILGQNWLDYLRKPILSIDFEDGPYHRVESTHKDHGKEDSFVYIRVRVRNKSGRQVAKEVRLFLARIEEIDSLGDPKPTAFLGSRQMAWAGYKFVPWAIPSDLDFYADLARFSRSSTGWGISATLAAVFGSEHNLNSHLGTYRFHMAVTADNAEPATLVVDVTYNGDWRNVDVKVVPAPSWAERMQAEPGWVTALK
jgi:hypothetical protein